MGRRSASASDFTPDGTERIGPVDVTYPLSNLHCTDEQRQAAARKVRAYVDALPVGEQQQAWEDTAGALGLAEEA